MNAKAVCVVVAVLLLGCVEKMTMPTKEEPAGATLFVAVNGNDAWSGQLAEPNPAKTDGPFATLDRARDEIRKMKKTGPLPTGGVAVYLRGGTYEHATTLELTAEDSGTEQSPIQYRPYKREKVRLVGGKVVRDFKPVTDTAVLSRLDPSARGKVLQSDLRAQGITDVGTAQGGGLQLFFDDKPMTLARWPNEGFVRIVEPLGKTERDVRGTKGRVEGVFSYEGDRPKRWAGDKDVWLHGYWFWDWADQRQKVETIDTDRRVITLVPPHHNYGYRKGQWFYAYNVLAELDSPGEWYLDREKGILYFWPPRSVEKGNPTVSILNTLITVQDASFVTFRGLTVEALRGTGISIKGGERNQVAGCTFKNLGGLAVRIAEGAKSGVVGCDVSNMGTGGISLSGGDRKTLIPCGHYAQNNHLHHYGLWKPMYSAGISISGVGIRVANNLIHDAPHQAMSFGGNDHVIEYNEIHSVCFESNDAGAIYSGRNWTMRGTVIRYNFMHHICGFEGRGCVGVYLDDMYCGTTIYGNLFYRVPMAAFVGGGRDCIIENNIFVDCVPAVHVDARALGWAHPCADGWIKEGREKGMLSGIAYNKPPYSERYPKLVNILSEEPAAPVGNIVVRNVCWGGKWDGIDARSKPYVTVQDNLLDQDPRFTKSPKVLEKIGGFTKFRLRDDSPAWKLGFKPIPVEKIGLYKDETRASWPVKQTIRPMIPRPAPPAKPRPVPRKGPAPVFPVLKASAPITVDGDITPSEWAGADPKKAMVIERGVLHELLQPKSLAWLARDDDSLYVGILNEVDVKKPLRMGAKWGQDDAVEVALQDPAAGKKAPIFVLRGYPNGRFESSTEAGAPAGTARKAGDAVKFAAKVVDAGHWSAEYRIPFAALGIDLKHWLQATSATQGKLAFNVSVRKSAAPIWLMWQGTGAHTWDVGNAGFIALTR